MRVRQLSITSDTRVQRTVRTARQTLRFVVAALAPGPGLGLASHLRSHHLTRVTGPKNAKKRKKEKQDAAEAVRVLQLEMQLHSLHSFS